MRWQGVLAALLLLSGAPALALEPVPGPDSAIVGQIESALLAYRDYYRQWPSTVVQLQWYAQQTRRPLDLSGFANLGLTQATAQTVFIEYITKTGEHGGFAISVRDVHRR